MCFVKLTLIISRTKQNYTKSSTAPESELKIKAYYVEYFNEILLMSAVRCKQRILLEKRLYNIFEITNVTALIKAILKTLVKLL